MTEEKKEKEFGGEDSQHFVAGENGTVIPKSEKAGEESRKEDKKAVPEASFSNFILSLNAQALVFLGALPHPETNRIESNILVAKHTIDILDILKEKTKGNLTHDEEKLLEEVLFRLKLIYVEVQKKGETK